MKLTGEKSKDKVALLASMLPIGKQVTVSFSKHPPDDAFFVDCYLATQAGIKAMLGNPPNKKKVGGKEVAVPTVSLVFDNGTEHPLKLKRKDRNISYAFHLVIDDIDVYQRIGGVDIILPSATISIKET